ncbi:MAG: ATP-binding protein [Thermodesulfobacteriota bacterium]|nr:ATP-binding protein [Thermodesulfobacteriota bacterium]
MVHLKEKLKAFLLLRSLRVKVMLGVVLILLIGMGTFTYIDVVSHRKDFLEEEERKAAETSDTVMKSIEYPMLDGEMEQVQSILERLRTLRDIDVVHLCDAKGVIRHSGVEEGNIGRVTESGITLEALRAGKLTKGLEMRWVEHPEKPQKLLRYALPIPNEKACFKCHGEEPDLLGVLTVGYKWDRIEEMVGGHLRRDLFYFIISITLIGFVLNKWLTKAITRPMSVLTAWTDEVSRGNLEVKLDLGKGVRCWELENCDKKDCPSYGRTDVMCWFVDGTLCRGQPMGKFPDKLKECRECVVYREHVGDEIVQLGDSFCHMVSELKRSREELSRMYERNLRAERLATLGKGAAHMAHEIKNPLMLIGGFSKQVFESLGPEDPNRKKLRIVTDEIKRLEGLLVDVSDFARMAQPQKSIENINDVALDVYNLMSEELQKQGIEFTQSLKSDIPASSFDPRQIKQVLINLAKNAVEAMPQGGKLDITTDMEGQMIKVIVTDTGKGIPSEKLQDIFNPFVTTKPKGTGLGLAISRKIIEDHGGTIDIKSKVGEGTACIVKVPITS